MTTPKVQLDRVVKSFGDNVVLDGFDLDVGDGEVISLIGASGFATEAAVIAPSILVDDLELHPLEDELPKLPVVPAPTLSVR